MSATLGVSSEASTSGRERIPMLDDGTGNGRGFVVMGTYLGYEVAVRTSVFDDGRSAGLEWLAEHGKLALDAEDRDAGPSTDDATEWVDGFGYAVTVDIVARTIGDVR